MDLRCSEQYTFFKYLDSVLRYCIFCTKNLPKIVKNALLEKIKTVISDFLYFYVKINQYLSIIQ
jgi:hypothetical protein